MENNFKAVDKGRKQFKDAMYMLDAALVIVLLGILLLGCACKEGESLVSKLVCTEDGDYQQTSYRKDM